MYIIIDTYSREKGEGQWACDSIDGRIFAPTDMENCVCLYAVFQSSTALFGEIEWGDVSPKGISCRDTIRTYVNWITRLLNYLIHPYYNSIIGTDSGQQLQGYMRYLRRPAKMHWLNQCIWAAKFFLLKFLTQPVVNQWFRSVIVCVLLFELCYERIFDVCSIAIGMPIPKLMELLFCLVTCVLLNLRIVGPENWSDFETI